MGFIGFKADVTRILRPGANRIAVDLFERATRR
jgi:hypothetical protein